MPPSPAPNSCIVFLVRHGATDNNVADPPILQGCRTDLGLSQEGGRQAGRAARLLADQSLAAVYSSPLRRAMETARYIAEPHKLEVETVASIREADVGLWESRSWEEIEETEPEAHQRFIEDASTFGYPGGENMTQVLERVAPAIEQLMQANLGKQIVVVGHNVVNRVFLAHLLGTPLSRAARQPRQLRCEYRALPRRGHASHYVELKLPSVMYGLST